MVAARSIRESLKQLRVTGLLGSCLSQNKVSVEVGHPCRCDVLTPTPNTRTYTHTHTLCPLWYLVHFPFLVLLVNCMHAGVFSPPQNHAVSQAFSPNHCAFVPTSVSHLDGETLQATRLLTTLLYGLCSRLHRPYRGFPPTEKNRKVKSRAWWNYFTSRHS